MVNDVGFADYLKEAAMSGMEKEIAEKWFSGLKPEDRTSIAIAIAALKGNRTGIYAVRCAKNYRLLELEYITPRGELVRSDALGYWFDVGEKQRAPFCRVIDFYIHKLTPREGSIIKLFIPAIGYTWKQYEASFQYRDSIDKDRLITIYRSPLLSPKVARDIERKSKAVEKVETTDERKRQKPKGFS